MAEESASRIVLDAWHRLVQAGYRFRFDARRSGKYGTEHFEALEEELARLVRDCGQLAETLKTFQG